MNSVHVVYGRYGFSRHVHQHADIVVRFVTDLGDDLTHGGIAYHERGWV